MSRGAFALPHCESCARPHWPPREICPHCLGDTIVRRPADGAGRVLATAVLHRSLSPDYRPHLPLHLATLALDCGVTVIAYLADGPVAAGTRVHVEARREPFGRSVFLALPGNRPNARLPVGEAD